jgi:predicted nucleotidyltransferase
MKIICEIVAGSRLYGIETPESDNDIRGVFLNTSFNLILGLDKVEINKKESEDILYFELKHFLSRLRKTNTQMIELLFAEDEDFTTMTPEFLKIKENKLKLIDSETLFNSLMGYIENEKRLANGERTGKLGGKRKCNLDQYGFSPKNFSHLFRLAHCGAKFFETDNYPVNIKKSDIEFRNFIYSVKTEPHKFNKEYLNSMTKKSIEKLKTSFNNRKNNFKFDSEFANYLCYEFYMPFLTNVIFYER